MDFVPAGHSLLIEWGKHAFSFAEVCLLWCTAKAEQTEKFNKLHESLKANSLTGITVEIVDQLICQHASDAFERKKLISIEGKAPSDKKS